MYTTILWNKISNEIKQYYGYEFNTFIIRSFNWIYKLFYKKGWCFACFATKTVSVKLEQYLTPLALAIWITDDGGWAKPGVRISSNSFKLEEVQLLANLFFFLHLLHLHLHLHLHLLLLHLHLLHLHLYEEEEEEEKKKDKTLFFKLYCSKD